MSLEQPTIEIFCDECGTDIQQLRWKETYCESCKDKWLDRIYELESEVKRLTDELNSRGE